MCRCREWSANVWAIKLCVWRSMWVGQEAMSWVQRRRWWLRQRRRFSVWKCVAMCGNIHGITCKTKSELLVIPLSADFWRRPPESFVAPTSVFVLACCCVGGDGDRSSWWAVRSDRTAQNLQLVCLLVDDLIKSLWRLTILVLGFRFRWYVFGFFACLSQLSFFLSVFVCVCVLLYCLCRILFT